MVTEQQVLQVLETINDPEMPISIVDLGIVHAVEISADRVAVDLLPTFIGCPALPMIEDSVRAKVGALPGVSGVDVQSRFDPPWTPERISERGRESLRKFGVTMPRAHVCEHKTESEHPRCPFCNNASVTLESPFGPTRCRMIYYCAECKNSFEHMKRLSLDLT